MIIVKEGRRKKKRAEDGCIKTVMGTIRKE
jgi:hypothetical protein